jgi:hypothetical protein
MSTLLSNPLIIVIPMKIIKKLELWKNEKMIFSQSYQEGTTVAVASSSDDDHQEKTRNQRASERENEADWTQSNDEETVNKPMVLPLSALSGTVSLIQPLPSSHELPSISSLTSSLNECLVITDVSNQQTILSFSELTPDYVYRIYDLVDLLLQVRKKERARDELCFVVCCYFFFLFCLCFLSLLFSLPFCFSRCALLWFLFLGKTL